MRSAAVFAVSSALLVGWIFSTAALGQDCINYGKYSRRVGGLVISPLAGEVMVAGDRAYVDVGELLVVDISDAYDPEIVASIDTGWSTAVTVAGDYGYWASDTLEIVDISDPTAPVTVGTLELSGDARNIVVAGDHAYVGCRELPSGGSYWLLVVDVSNPAEPYSIGSVDMPGALGDTVVMGDYAYVACYGGGLQVVEVSNPAEPEIVGSCDMTAVHVAVTGGYAYVTSNDGLQVVDISDPSAPAVVNTLNIFAVDMTVAEGHIYVASHYVYGQSRLVVLDLSDPAAPEILFSVATTVGAWGGVAAADGYAYVTGGESGTAGSFGALDIIDVTSMAAPASLGEVAAAGRATDLAIAENLAYETFGGVTGALRIVDISNPLAPAIIGAVETTDTAHAVAVADTFAYVAWGSGGLQVIDVADPAEPLIVGNADTQAFDVAVSEGYAYVACHGDGFQIFDLSEPTAPVILGSAPDLTPARRVTVVGDIAYVLTLVGFHSTTWLTMYVLDVSNPAGPVTLGSIGWGGQAYPGMSEVVVEGHFAYLSSYGAFRVIDVSNPANPQEVAHTWLPLWGGNGGLTLSGDRAYVNHAEALHVIDVSSPTGPAYIGAVDLDDGARAVAVDGSCVYVALDGWQAHPDLVVFPMQCAPVPVGVASFQKVLPKHLVLHQNRPNPFSPATALSYTLPTDREVLLAVHDVRGRRLVVLADGHHEAGEFVRWWDGRDAHGRPVASGVYFARLQAGDFTATRKMVLLR